MQEIFIRVSSPTYAQKAARLLRAAGISYRIVRVSRRTGCGADVQVLDRDYGEALRILKEGGVRVVSG